MRNREISDCCLPSTVTCNASNGRYHNTPSGTITSSCSDFVKSAGEFLVNRSRTLADDCFHFALDKSLKGNSPAAAMRSMSRSIVVICLGSVADAVTSQDEYFVLFIKKA